MNEQIKNATTELRQNADDAKPSFGGLNVSQLNWKPAEKSWSIAQCLDHVIVTHSMYFPEFEKIASDTFRSTTWQKISPLSGFFGRFLIKGLNPSNLKPMKTTSKASPSSSEIAGDIVDRYARHQDQMIAALEKMPTDIDTTMVITSPLMGLVTYSLADALTFIPMHCTRHLLQAKRVTDANGFPR